MPNERKRGGKQGCKRNLQVEKTLYKSIYQIELARGSSYIASTCSPATQRIAITEVFQEFHLRYGPDTVSIFRELLAESLRQRNNLPAAQAVLSFEAC
ncbi:hypothetical protein [Paraburkholderia fynbosensis]|uniref:Uncharacterized protein n=1 Tax=Paraburkholderia fynbosensis TaxID=1200993 RepID=A0A6J5FD77_9BURK|nr:hypothetical protein [Paraburkholderia fynbosensis]CAB3776069.1 hypothetical protein LMG27177_00068 [Paraburkholderia fynbosensis]